jgi:tripartite-type tricarboxylate transporter receptor subunit TctC
MNLPLTRRTLLLAGAALAAGAARADEYPERAITIVVPFPPAGASDVLARIVGDKLASALRQPVTVENRPGGGTVIGTADVARAAPNGYTLLLTNNSLPVNATLKKQLPYDTRAFVPVAYIGEQPNLLVVNNEVPARTVQEFIALARSKPGKIAIASGGNGGSSHLALELFKMRAKVDLLHVPYQGSAPAVTALLAGNVQGFFDTISSSAPYVKSGRMRALAVTTRDRNPLLPDVPSLMESGVPDYDASNWNGVYAPPGTQSAIAALLNARINSILALPDVRDKLLASGITPRPSPPEFLRRTLDAEIIRWGEVIRAGGIQPD